MSNAPRFARVLLVEDDETLCRVIERNLAKSGVDVRRASSVKEALAAIDGRRPDLLLLDISLPDRSGWDIVREMRARAVELPVVVISAVQVQPERLQEFRPLAYLPKPFPIDALMRILVGTRDTNESSGLGSSMPADNGERRN